jgi:hypothetical protein
MNNDAHQILDDILSAWHRWAQGYQHVGGVSSSPMFRNAKTSRGWDTVDEIVNAEIDGDQMKAVDFHVMQLCDVYRTALQINARNLATGRSVWTSVRLPAKPEERAVILSEARTGLTVRLRDAGIL